MAGSKQFNFSQDILAQSYTTEQELLLEAQRAVLENIQLTKAALAMLHPYFPAQSVSQTIGRRSETCPSERCQQKTLIALFTKIHQALTDLKARQRPEK
jgi:hypothetical protein